MAKYKKVLLAVDFHTDNDLVVARGNEICKENGADLWLIHIVEPLVVASAVDSMSNDRKLIDIEELVQKESRSKMEELGDRLSVKPERMLVCRGQPAREIHAAVEKNDIDLVVLGTHGQSGLQLLLGSTANSVLHGISCDVLAVRVK